jgi:hypothetical protein
MKYEFRRTLLREDYDARIRIYADPDAVVINAATVTMLDDELTLYPTGTETWSHERLMAECMRNAAWLRSPKSLGKHYPHPGDLIPFAEIVLTDRERIFARGRLLVTAGMGHVGEDDHTYPKHVARNVAGAEQRVAYLGEAIDLLAFLERKKKRAAT